MVTSERGKSTSERTLLSRILATSTGSSIFQSIFILTSSMRSRRWSIPFKRRHLLAPVMLLIPAAAADPDVPLMCE